MSVASNYEIAASVYQLPAWPGRSEVPCALVRCGTSRALILPENSLLHSAQRDDILLSLLHDEAGEGLGGNHYQSNKLAVIHPSSEPSAFTFEFYQADIAERRLLPLMECGNVSAAAALVAVLSGQVRPDWRGIVRGLNTGTHQTIELAPVDGMPRPAGDWCVRFLARSSYSSSPAVTVTHGDGRSLETREVQRGNRFIFANAVPEAAEPELIQYLSEVIYNGNGSDFPHERRPSTARRSPPKVIFYSVVSREPAEAVIRAACFFEGEQHRSLPGSAAMALSGFLAETHLEELEPADPEGELSFDLLHPSGCLTVIVRWQKDAAGYRIRSTEFVTPVKLLFWGRPRLNSES